METITRLKLSKWALAFAIVTAVYCTLRLLGSVMGDPNPRMSPAEKARDTQAKNLTDVYFRASWLIVAAVTIYARWQKHLWKVENANAAVGQN